MRTHPGVAALGLLASLASIPALPVATADAQAVAEASVGGLRVDAITNAGLAVGALGNTCVYAEAAGTAAPAANYRIAPPPPVTCAFAFVNPPFSAVGAITGLGHLNVPKFPVLPVPGTSDFSGNTITAGGVTSSASANWVSTETDFVLFVARSADLGVRTNVRGRPGLAAARSWDPWFFSPSTDQFLELMITLEEADLLTMAGANETAEAQFEVGFEFGRGSVVGENVLRSGGFSHAISGNDSFLLPSPVVLIDEDLALEGGEQYWLTAFAAGVGRTSVVPEPATLALVGGGLLALSALGARRRRL